MTTLLARQNPERTAWVVLWLAFLTFCALLYFVPSRLTSWAQRSTVNQNIAIEYNGTVYFRRPGFDRQELPQGNVPVGSTLYTLGNTQVTLNFIAPGTQDSLATLVVYGGATIMLESAASPRFPWWSTTQHEISVRIEKGVVRATTNGDPRGRTVRLQINAVPNVVAVLDTPGSNVRIDTASQAETVITVREGEAQVSAQNETRRVAADQRVDIVPGQAPGLPLPAERNLIRDGEFQQALGASWNATVSPPGDTTGRVEPGAFAGRQAIRFQRINPGWGEVGLTQTLNDVDVRDFNSLKLQFEFFLSFQDPQIYNCGDRGTECPVMVKLRYVDVFGAEREWVQGFYYNASSAFGETVCLPCPEPLTDSHLRFERGRWQTYDSPNLLAIFRVRNAAPAVLKSITVYGAGHSFDSYVTQMQLLVSD
jgi:hypothetical protein